MQVAQGGAHENGRHADAFSLSLNGMEYFGSAMEARHFDTKGWISREQGGKFAVKLHFNRKNSSLRRIVAHRNRAAVGFHDLLYDI